MTSPVELEYGFLRRGTGSGDPWLGIPGRGRIRWLVPSRREALIRSLRLAVPGRRATRWFYHGLRLGLAIHPLALPGIAVAFRADAARLAEIAHAGRLRADRIIAAPGNRGGEPCLILSGESEPEGMPVIARWSLSADSDAGVRHEAAMLAQAAEDGFWRSSCPRTISLGMTGDGRPLHVQSLLAGTPVPIAEAMGLARWLADRPAALQAPLRRYIDRHPQAAAAVRTLVPEAVWEESLAVEVPYGLIHGDATTWNAHRHAAGYAMFDWECAEPEAPIGIDALYARLSVPWVVRGTQVPGPVRAQIAMPMLIALAVHLTHQPRLSSVAGPCQDLIHQSFHGHSGIRRDRPS